METTQEVVPKPKEDIESVLPPKKNKKKKNKKKKAQIPQKPQEQPTPSVEEVERMKKREALKTRLNALKYNRARYNDDNVEYKDGKVVGRKVKAVFNPDEKQKRGGLDMSKLRELMETVKKDPQALTNLIAKSGMTEEQILEIAKKYDPKVANLTNEAQDSQDE